MSFTYDDNGLRTSKTVNGITTEYYWNGNLLVAEQTPYSLTVYNYDATGRPIGMSYRENSYGQYQWDVYWFDLNLQGDIVAVYNKTGVKLVSYSYDPWGKCTVTYSNGGASTSAVKNNLRYRGYYLDSDLGLYYLQSRYYDPNTYRFISPDSVMSGVNGSLNGFNLYVYCFNNPINMTDAQGNWPKWIEDAWDWVTDAILSVGDFIEDNVGLAVIQSQSYDTITFQTMYADLETGYGSSCVIAGDVSKPISFFVSNASAWWKVWEYKIGMQVNVNDGGFAIATGVGEQTITVSRDNNSTEFSYGINKFAITVCDGVNWNNRSCENYTQAYIRTVPTATAVLLTYYTCGAASGVFFVPIGATG